MLQPLQSCQNLVMVQTWASYCFTAWSLMVSPVAWSTVICPIFLRPMEGLYPNQLYSSCCLCDQGFIFSFVFLCIFFFFNSQLCAIYCLPQIASFCLYSSVRREKEKLFHTMRQFYFTTLFPLPQSYSSSQLMGSITLSFWRGGRELYPEQQLSSLPQPDDYSESAGSPPHPAYLHSSSLFLPSSLLLPSLNKSLASEGWDSSCCCLALIWCNDTHNAACGFFFSPPHSKT